MNGGLQSLNGERILSPAIDVAVVRANSVGGDRHPLEHAMRIAFQDGAVHESTRVTLVGIADDVLRGGDLLGDSGPLQAGRITRPAATTQSAARDLIDHLLWGQLRHSLGESPITARREVILDAFRIDASTVLEHDLVLASE